MQTTLEALWLSVIAQAITDLRHRNSPHPERQEIGRDAHRFLFSGIMEANLAQVCTFADVSVREVRRAARRFVEQGMRFNLERPQASVLTQDAPTPSPSLDNAPPPSQAG